jgi:hypothetical protein
LFDEQGRINNEGTVEFLQTVIDAFIEMVELYQKAPKQEGIS